MKIKKLNELTYVFRFDSDIQAKKLFTFLSKASVCYCGNAEVHCEDCLLLEGCHEYWKLLDTLPEIEE